MTTALPPRIIFPVVKSERWEMKRYIASILIPCLLLYFYGCYSTRALSIDQDLLSSTDEDSDVKYFLNDGQNISCDPASCIYITQKNFVLFEKQFEIDTVSGDQVELCSRVEAVGLDSIEYSDTNSINFTTYWLDNGEGMTFYSDDIIFDSYLDPDSAYWVIADCDQPKLIPVSEVKSIEVKTPTTFLRIVQAAGGLALLFLLIGISDNFEFE